jgi:O-antigen ligase
MSEGELGTRDEVDTTDGSARAGYAAELSHAPRRGTLVNVSEVLTAWFMIALLAWAQFPLGSNRPWAWSLLAALVAVNWVIWLPAAIADPESTLRALRKVRIPAAATVIVLLWALVQTATWTPSGWHNSIWAVGSEIPGLHLRGSISMNRYSTFTEIMKLATYLAAFWLAYVCARRADLARQLFIAIFVIGVGYAIYGLALHFVDTSQFQILEGTRSAYGSDVSGGFVSKNSFATFDGIILMVGLSLLLDSARQSIITTRGSRTMARSALQFALGPGAVAIVGVLLLTAALMASNSRAGILAMIIGLLALFSLFVITTARTATVSWLYTGGAALVLVLAFLFLIEGSNVAERFASLFETGAPREWRPIIWSSAERAIFDHPLQGVGLGAFRDSYNLYADEFVPYVVDRVHNDYLEFALGLGIPAALMWWGAMALVLLRCVQGALERRRRQIYAIAASSSFALVAFHSFFDFSLQMPAVSLLFSAIFGIGFAQSFATRRTGARAS